MKSILPIIISFGVAVAILGCSGAQQSWRPLYFERPPKGDTGDYIHIMLKDQPLSIEVLGRLDSLIGNYYRIFLQVGIYGSPGFDIQRLVLRPESIAVSVNGFQFKDILSDIVIDLKPWDALCLRKLFFNKDSLLNELGDASVLRMEIRLDGFVNYDGHPLAIEPIIALDP
ncbi:MAG: hypothetical protein PHR28_10835 [candidate division Zixibacteria bacterium]|nr:hypothetical protein [candidate division Zixibacteria bacterium]